jgi:3-oxoacyl-[acyl-carrier protein] reductase
MNLGLTGKRAVVCGSTQGIGKAIAIELAHSGCAVTLVARNEEKLLSVKAELNNPELHSILVADFSWPEQLRQTIVDYVQKVSVNHILVNNTGGPAAGPAIEAETDHFEQAFRQHLVNNQNLVKLLTPGMKEAGFGRIINIISTSVKEPIPNLGVSNTIRGAVASWAKTLAAELGPFGITVNNVLPGFTKTGRLDALIAGNARKQQISEEEVQEKMISQVPARRFAEAAEIAAAVAFLASTAAAYINGINLPVDGGKTGCL